MKYAEIVFPIKIYKEFTYKIPEKFAEKIKKGQQTIVPFGRQFIIGIVSKLKNDIPEHLNPKKIKEIQEICFPEIVINDEIFKLAEFMSYYYFAPLGSALNQMIPNLFSKKIDKKILFSEKILLLLQSEKNINETIIKKISSLGRNSIEINKFKKKFGTIIYNKIIKIIKNNELDPFCFEYENLKQKPVYEKIYSINFDQAEKVLNQKLGKKMKKIFDIIQENNSITQSKLKSILKFSASSLKRLIEKDLINVEKVKITRIPLSMKQQSFPVKDHELTAQQKTIIESVIPFIKNKEFKTFLLHGVTGSGKTLCYIKCVQNAVENGFNALILVPEISLTPQTINIFNSYFPGKAAVFHSGLTDGERFDIWKDIYKQKYRVIVGPRSAVLSPIKNLGIIIVDEEHEHAYKQNRMPFYNGRDIAIYRASINNCPIVLGSATPTIESMYNCSTKYSLLKLSKRISDKPMPEVEIIDMKKEKKYSFYSSQLLLEIENTLNRNEQVIILQNHRGYFSSVRCNTCGYVFQCPDCSVSMKYHHSNFSLKCHYCEKHLPAPVECPECKSIDLNYSGAGTERINDNLQDFFPEYKVVRVDRDITSKKNKLEEILDKFRKEEIQILVGTQIIAKGLDFPNIGLVGVINADTALNMPDFRSQEKTFQLLTQVAGRTGRHDKKGKVIIQTYYPDHYAVLYAQTHDYDSFYEKEIMKRELTNYPPYNKIVRIISQDKSEEKAENDLSVFIEEFKKEIRNHKKFRGYEILGPAPAPISKIKQNFRFHVLIKYRQINLIRTIINKIIKHIDSKILKNLTIDADPLDML